MNRKLKKQKNKQPIHLVLPNNKSNTINLSNSFNFSKIQNIDKISSLFANIKPSEPMLAQPIHKFNELLTLNANLSDCIYEEKYDGQRMLSFISQTYCNFYSRNLKPFTFPFNINLQPNCINCLIDGELVYVDNKTNDIVPFCDTGLRTNHNMVYLIYDIQYYNNEAVMPKSLIERKSILKTCIQYDNHVKLTEWFECESLEKIKFEFNNILKFPNKEGLIVKSKYEAYIPNCRRWIKLKALHLDQFKNEYDLYAHRALKDKNGIYAILECGEYDENNKFIKICNVSSGITNDQRTQILLLVDDHGFFRNKVKVTVIAERQTIYRALRHPKFKHFRFDLPT